jgi:hypothetical protein
MLENYTNVTPNIKGCSSKIKVFEGQFPWFGWSCDNMVMAQVHAC